MDGCIHFCHNKKGRHVCGVAGLALQTDSQYYLKLLGIPAGSKRISILLCRLSIQVHFLPLWPSCSPVAPSLTGGEEGQRRREAHQGKEEAGSDQWDGPSVWQTWGWIWVIQNKWDWMRRRKGYLCRLMFKSSTTPSPPSALCGSQQLISPGLLLFIIKVSEGGASVNI